jgi:hypothetical protein
VKKQVWSKNRLYQPDRKPQSLAHNHALLRIE